jgi:hypothetical protein
VAFILLVVPFMLAIFYPALTHSSPQAALKEVIVYLNSPFVMVFIVVAIVIGWVQIFLKYRRTA